MREKGPSARRPRAQRSRSSKVRSTRGISPSHDHSLSLQSQDVSLIRMLETLKPHDHLCLIYESQEEWRAAVVPFISMGLKRGEKCCYFADAHTAEQLHGYLQAEGVDVASTEASGQLVILCESEAYTKEGSFDPDLMISLLITETEKAIAEGYPALRLTGEMTWVLHGLPGSERLLEYEAKLNRDFYSKYPALGICQYDRWKFDPEVIKGVIMTHPLLVRGNRIYHNFYYVPPEEFLNRKRAELEVQHWLNNVEREQRVMDTLRQSENKYRTLTEQSLQGLLVIQDFRIVFANTVSAEISGYSVEELLSLPPAKVQAMVHPEDQALVWGCLQDRLAGKTVPSQYEYRGIRKDGTMRWLEMFANRIEYGGKPAIQAAIVDITERKKAEEILSSSEERFRLLYERAPLAYQSLDADGRFITVNQVWLNTMGYSREEVIGRWFGDFFAPHEVEAFKKRFTEFKARGEVEAEIEIVKKDGSHAIMVIIGSIGYDEQVRFKQTHCILTDITERKRTEEILRESEQKYRLLAENARDIIWTMDMNLQFTYMSPSVLQVRGYTVEEVMAQSLEEVFTPSSLEIAVKAFAEELALESMEPKDLSRVRTLELEHICKDGSTVRVEINASFLRDTDGQPIGILGVSRDITDRRKSEEALRQSEEKYRTILAEIADSYFEVDLAGNLTFVNDATCRNLAYSREELLGMNYRNFTAQEDIEHVYRAFNQVYRTGEPNKGFLWKVIRKDGSIGFADASVSLLRSQTGEIIGFRGVGCDITERKVAEEERRQLELKAQATSRLASVGEMAAGVAHEINNPLTGVIGYAQLLIDRKDIPSDIRSDLAAINECAQRVAGIVQRLLAFSRQTKPERKLVDINELIESTLVLRTYHLTANNIKVNTRLALDLPETVADPGQIQQVLLNLIVNAETEMKLAHGKGKLTITTEKSHNTIKICVKDNGPGIKPEVMDRIFDPFFTTREAGQGTGLGLSLCYGIVAEHKGKIYAESQPGKGATLTIELPVVTEVEPLKPSEPVVEQPGKVAKARILVVDDEKVVRDIVNRVLTGEGHKVETVDNADDALKKIESQRYNLILLDIKMPGMDGVELYRRIQKIAKSLTRRVVFITGDIMGADTEKFLSETKVAHVDKPFDAEQLSTEVQRALTAGR